MWNLMFSSKIIPLQTGLNQIVLNKFKMMNNRRLHTYNEAIKALNNLQTNASVLEKVKEERLKRYVNDNLIQMRKYLVKSGLCLDEFKNLNVIHISGTKGKGSTCAFIESILRQNGLKTGFYSSPHLVSVTERIKINGEPISQEIFAENFWSVYNKVAKDQPEKPAYFKFLTVLAFNIFVKEKVDVAVIEVGIGGAYDCTNVIENPVAVGITTLDYDHTKILGETIEEIAWHKAGIMKEGTVAFVNPYQPETALKVISQKSEETKCKLYGVPPLEDYDWGLFPPELSLFKNVHEINASMALQISRYFLTRSLMTKAPLKKNIRETNSNLPAMAPGFKIDAEQALGLKLCQWPGRSQKVISNGNTYFLDGAHTEQSMWACRSWFDHVLKNHSIPEKRILIFNSTGDRKSEVLLAPLLTFPFDLVIFCTNVTKEVDLASDNTNLNFSFQFALQKCEINKSTWDKLQGAKLENNLDIPESSLKIPNSQVVTHIEDAIKKVNPDQNTHVYVTGSLHLVGGVLSFIQPNCSESLDKKYVKELKETYKELQHKKSIESSAILC